MCVDYPVASDGIKHDTIFGQEVFTWAPRPTQHGIHWTTPTGSLMKDKRRIPSSRLSSQRYECFSFRTKWKPAAGFKCHIPLRFLQHPSLPESGSVGSGGGVEVLIGLFSLQIQVLEFRILGPRTCRSGAFPEFYHGGGFTFFSRSSKALVVLNRTGRPFSG